MADTAELLKRSHAGDKEARDRLVMENAGLVWSIVRRFIGRGPEPDDLFQIGNIGLIKAIDHFDTELGVRFSTERKAGGGPRAGADSGGACKVGGSQP